MARVEWSRLSGEEVEQVLAVLVNREFPNSFRIRPGQGDGGIDILVPGSEGSNVFQVKSFTGSLTTNHKRQILHSLDTFSKTVSARGLQVAKWTLIRPEDPTLGDIDWLRDATDGFSFPCEWAGLTLCDALAAKYPDVIDYYLRDGKGRLEEALQRILAVGSTQLLVKPADAIQEFENLYAVLNSIDPHYRYNFAVHDEQDLPLHQQPETSGATWQRISQDNVVTVWIVPRYREALLDRPIDGTFCFAPETNEEDLADFLHYGRPLERVRVTNLKINMPGGLGLEGEDFVGQVSIQPAASSPGLRPVDLVVTDAAGHRLAVAELEDVVITRGVVGSGSALVGRAWAGLLTCELRFREGDTATIGLALDDISGSMPAVALAAVQFVAACSPPNCFGFGLRHGPLVTPLEPFPQALSDQSESLLVILRALTTIQEHSTEVISVPSSFDSDVVTQWLRAAHLLGGEEVRGSWTGEVTLSGDSVPSQGVPYGFDANSLYQVAIVNELVVRVGERDIHLGWVTRELAQARVSPGADGVLSLSPGNDDGYVERWVGPDNPFEERGDKGEMR